MTETKQQIEYLIAIAAATANKAGYKGTFTSLSTPDSITVTGEEGNIIVFWLTTEENTHHYRIHHTDNQNTTQIYNINAQQENNEIIVNGLHQNHNAHILVSQPNTTDSEDTYHNTVKLVEKTQTKELTPA